MSLPVSLGEPDRLERLYRSLPIPIQNLSCNLVGLRTRQIRYNRRFEELSRRLAAEEHLSWDEIEDLRISRLRGFVKYAFDHSVFWRQRLREFGADPSDLRSASDLTDMVPVMDKEVARRNAPEIACRHAGSSLTTLHTSGTTGAGLRFPATLDAVREQWAVWWRFQARQGIPFGTRSAWFGGRLVVPIEQKSPPYWRRNRIGGQLLFSAVHTSPENMSQYVDELERSRVPWIYGYPSLVAMVAAEMVQSGRRLPQEIRAVTTSSEVLRPHQRRLIEDAFGVQPRQHYSMTEAVAAASECAAGKLHVDETFAFVEFVERDAGWHEVVGTNLSNPAFPLIRYATGDMVRLGVGCSCGLAGRVIEAVDGRSVDSIVLPSGARVRGVDHLFKDLTSISAAQVYQPEVGRVIVRVVGDPGLQGTDLEALKVSFESRIGEGTRVDVEQVDSLPRLRSGKQQLVVSEVTGE